MKIIRNTIRAFAGAAVAAALGLAALPAAAQTIGIGTTQGGATGQIGIAIAQAVSQNSDLRALPQVSANTSQYIPLVDAGRLELGVANYPQTYYAIQGTGMSTEAAANLRVVATLMPFLAALVTAESSGIETYADIAGRNVPRYPENSLGDFIIRATLAAGGLTYDDVNSVPISNFPQQYEAFKAGQIAVSIASVGAQPTFDLEASVGKIQFIPVPQEAEEQIRTLLPGAYLHDVAASDTLPGLGAATTVIAYDYMLFAGASVPDDVIGKVVRAMYEGAEGLKASSPVWADFDRDQMGKAAEIPYHPGAAAYYQEIGIAE
ncbi:TAXI family TRAP transporter solute-binding subunit [Aquibium carbonis]|nr:TAXI family TRAP transporter solute-binding subunit [Aquibium carbonis]